MTFKVYFICVPAAFRSNVAAPEDFDVIGGTSELPESLAVKCCCAKAVLVTIATMAVNTRSVVATTSPKVMFCFNVRPYKMMSYKDFPNSFLNSQVASINIAWQ